MYWFNLFNYRIKEAAEMPGGASAGAGAATAATAAAAGAPPNDR